MTTGKGIEIRTEMRADIEQTHCALLVIMGQLNKINKKLFGDQFGMSIPIGDDSYKSIKDYVESCSLITANIHGILLGVESQL